ncbi:MAG: DUF465 domain-containing protein [Candidatus Aminicenantes bacterium]|nr:DUF465 domain-containing protein [Candidatus Aminicenantes bacterium]
MSEYKIKEFLLNNNKDFKKLFDLHQKCEKELANLSQNSNISAEESINMKIIKKKKLSLKDSMQRMILEQGNKKQL